MRPAVPLRSLPALAALLLAAALGGTVGAPALLAQEPGYPDWQQRVAYDMDVTLYADRHQMDGRQTVTYYNNSPDTLRQFFYHLYFNAFNPTSMMAERNRVLPDPDSRVVPRIFELGPDEIGYHHIVTLAQDGVPVTWEVDDTVVQVDLARPIPPGATATFTMTFESQVPLQTRRSGRDNREGIDYSMAQWYPKVAMYDERGWHADPYVGREFYAPFGTFDVRIRIPSEYVVGATGVLQNPLEIGHGYADVEPAGDTLTYHFVAEDVHDFAWGADPDYIHERFTVDGIEYHLFYQPDVAERWEPMRAWVPTIINFFSANYGPYPYPQYSVVQGADGGMEYPMMTLITGRRSPASLFGVTAHEAAHEWYYAALASNEADYAWMDEGFTSYATAEVTAFVASQGRAEATHTGAFLSILRLQDQGLFERLNTPSDWFRTNAAYGAASYSGGEMLLDMLGYVISDPLRDAFLLEYYDRFLYRHPDPYDVEKTAEDVSGLRLDWYFEQFLETERTLNYALRDLDQEATAAGIRAVLTIAREDDVVMPVDVRLTLEDGTEQWVTIPLSIMQGHKPVPADWIVAEPWFWTSETYALALELPARVVSAELDPYGETPERTRLDNTLRFPVESAFLRAPQPGWFHYSVGWRPLLQYAADFGVGGGLTARGTYLFGDHRTEAMLKLWSEPFVDDADVSDASAFDGLDWAFGYAGDARPFGARAEVRLSSDKHLATIENRLSFAKPLGRFSALTSTDRRLTLTLAHTLVPSERSFLFDRVREATPAPDVVVDPFPVRSAPALLDAHGLSARLAYEIRAGADAFVVGVEVGGYLGESTLATGVGDDAMDSANRFFLAASKAATFGPFLGTARLRASLGDRDLAVFKRPRLGGGTPEDAWRNDAFRTAAAAFDDATGDAHLAPFSGTGPVGYLLEDGAEHLLLQRGLLEGRLALGLRPFPGAGLLAPLTVEAFSGFGNLWATGSSLQDLFSVDTPYADAGLGLRYDVSAVRALDRWTAQSDVLRSLQVVAQFPFWVNDVETPGAEAFDEVDVRWLVGVEVTPW